MLRTKKCNSLVFWLRTLSMYLVARTTDIFKQKTKLYRSMPPCFPITNFQKKNTNDKEITM